MEDIQIKELVEYIARCLAEHPEQIVVKEITGQQISVLELRAAKDDLGKIIGPDEGGAAAVGPMHHDRNTSHGQLGCRRHDGHCRNHPQ